VSDDYIACRKIDTIAVHGGSLFESVTGAVSVPLFESATFRHPGPGQSTGFDYSRTQNTTRLELEKTVSALEGAKYGLAFASGMAALSCLLKKFKPADHIIASEDLYGGTYRLFQTYYGQYGFRFTFTDTSDFAKTEAACCSETKAIFLETPSNPMMKVSDIEKTAAFIHKKGGILIVDNTFLTPYYQNPLSLGADIVIHSGTKYLSGHNDALSGLLVHSNDDFQAVFRDALQAEGATLSPFDAWLTVRGIKTLPLRMRRHWENGLAAAEYLRGHPLIEKVFYTGLPDHSQAALSAKQARGHNGMVSFYMKRAADVPALLSSLKLVMFAESLGGVESLITYPLVQTHSAIPPAMCASSGINDRLLRLSCGTEDGQDIIADLEQALEQVKFARGRA